ncbi:uncharacterized protein LOC101240273 isoform X2 [Hydra vulgaris]|uniref:Uncharacterized protein LOC101240273 isoform X2 n=1 Tax=Hydra vulgaris TaxID=6087 RepID=A0ABM4CYK0_HYDVU
MEKVLQSIFILVSCCSYIFGVVNYLIELHDLPNCFLDVNNSNKIIYNCDGGLKFSLVNGNPGVLFQSATDNTRYICHQGFVPHLLPLGGNEHTFYIVSFDDSYVMIRSKDYTTRYLWQDNLLFAFENKVGTTQILYKLIVCDFGIQNIDPISKYSVNVIINESSPIFNHPGLSFVIKCESSNNEINLFNVTGSSALINLLHSNTTYKFSAGFQNEYGIYVFGNASYYKTDEYGGIDSCIHGFVEGNVLNISLEMDGNGYNVTIEYFFPPFIIFTTDNVSPGFLKLNSNQTKYYFTGYFNTKVVNNVTLLLKKRKCLKNFPIEIPVNISYKNKISVMKSVTISYQKILPCLDENLPYILKDKNALKEYYGRGILVNADKSYMYICMNQNVESTKPACYFSNIAGDFMIDLDVTVGCVLGHHLVTKELHAIHRNQKLYLYFNTVFNKWLGLANQQFDKISLNLENQMMKNFEVDDDQYYTLGVNQWMGNAVGLFYRNGLSSLWTQRIKWNN